MPERIVWIPDLEGTAEQLNLGSFWKAFDRAAMAEIPDDDFAMYANQALILCLVRDWGIYSWNDAQTLVPDGEIVINGPNGQWILECPHGDAIFAYLEPRLSTTGDLQETISISQSINFGSINSGVASTPVTVSVPGAESGNEVSIGLPSGLETGIFVQGKVSAAGEVTLQAFNLSGSTVDPATADYTVIVRKF